MPLLTWENGKGLRAGRRKGLPERLRHQRSRTRREGRRGADGADQGARAARLLSEGRHVCELAVRYVPLSAVPAAVGRAAPRARRERRLRHDGNLELRLQTELHGRGAHLDRVERRASARGIAGRDRAGAISEREPRNSPSTPGTASAGRSAWCPTPGPTWAPPTPSARLSFSRSRSTPRAMTVENSWEDQARWRSRASINPIWPYAPERVIVAPDFTGKVNVAARYAPAVLAEGLLEVPAGGGGRDGAGVGILPQRRA